jgi:hypothetical protein
MNPSLQDYAASVLDLVLIQELQKIWTKCTVFDFESFVTPSNLHNLVVTTNNKGEEVHQLRRFRCISFTSQSFVEDILFLISIIFLLFLSDHSDISLTFKLWMFIVLSFILLFLDDSKKRIKGQSLSSYQGRIYHDEDDVRRNIHQKYGYPEAVSITQCDFNITTAKLIDDEVIGDESVVVPISESRTIFKIVVSTHNCR